MSPLSYSWLRQSDISRTAKTFKLKIFSHKPLPVTWNTSHIFKCLMIATSKLAVWTKTEQHTHIFAPNDYSGVPSSKVEKYLTFLSHLQLFFFSSFSLNLMRQIVAISCFLWSAAHLMFEKWIKFGSEFD